MARYARESVILSFSVPPDASPAYQVEKKPSPAFTGEGFVLHRIKSLAVTYFHIDKVDTSIGAERFHFRVRKGIGWFPLAMAARQNGCRGTSHVWPRHEFSQFVSSLKRWLESSHSRSINQVVPYTISLTLKGKSLGCYMVKPHGQLVLVS